ncbi:MAG: peptidylprolyl isomerase, partial [Gemmatimonadota bacterium]
ADIEPSEAEVRQFFDLTKPFTRMHLRRIVLTVPEAADDEVRDELFARAQALRARLDQGEDFVALAREHSSEQLAARGQLLQFQGHEDFPAGADSMVYALAAGELSPVVATFEAMLIYRVEEILAPEFDDVQEMTFNQVLELRKDSVATSVVDTLVENAFIAVRSGAVEAAREIASGDEDRVSDGSDLVTYRGGEVTAGELRLAFSARPDIRQMFASGSDEDLGIYLHELARDEVLIRAAYRAGAQPSAEQERNLQAVLAQQLTQIAANYRLSHNTVISPIFDVEAEAIAFLKRILLTQSPLPWLGEFRTVLDRDYPGRVDRHGADAAAAIAVSLRKEMAPATPAEGEAESEHSGE